VLGHRRAQIVADALLELEELRGDHRADRVATEVAGPGPTTAVAVEAGDRIESARLERPTKDVALHCATVSSLDRVSSERAARDPRERIAEGFRRFAREAAGRSPLYVEIAETVAATPWTLDFLAAMPEAKW